jgi:O-6-methylguanine DNA methyltransferase
MQPRRHEKTFTEKVLAVVKTIPRGQVLTYSEVAWKAGNHNAYRAVGTILSKNFDPKIPCHRVIKSDGDIGEYNRGKAEKLRKLRAEGVKIALQGK